MRQFASLVPVHRRPVRFLIATMLILGVAISPVGLLTQSSPAAAADGPVQIGIWQPPTPGDFRPLEELVDQLGRDVDIVPWYQAWESESNSDFRADSVAYVHSMGAIPMITWEPWNTSNGVNQPRFALRNIVGGDFDPYIRSWARGSREAGGPIYIRFAHEMNGDWYPWAVGQNGNTARDYRDAWNHVHQIFQDEGATNVQFVWSPNRHYDGAVPLETVFPGDQVVDWVAIDGYNFGTEYDWSNWRSFDETFAETYRIVTGLSDSPVMIGETGSSEAGGDKAAWIRDGLNPASLEQDYPRLAAVIWFNQVGSGNWPIQTSDAAQAAFIETIRSWPQSGSAGLAASPEDEQVEPSNSESSQQGAQGVTSAVREQIGSLRP